MKILYVCNASNFIGIGGMEYHLLDITTWMEGHGVPTALAVRKDTFFHRKILHSRQNVYPLSWTGLHKILSFFQVAKAIREFSPDIISINREKDIIRIFFIAKIVGLFLKKKPKIVAVFHNPGWQRFYILGMLDGILFPTLFMKKGYLPNNKGADAKAAVIYHGINVHAVDIAEKLNPERERKFFKGRGFPLIGMIGEMRKNQTELIDVAYHLKKKRKDFTIVFVGRGNDDEIKSLHDKIDRLGLSENFLFTGRVDRSLIPDVLYDLDISVTTNRDEPFGIVHIESLASCTPLVAYNSGGPVEILERGGGILVDGGPEEMAETIFKTISDHELRKRLGLAGRAAAEKYFSIDAMGEQHCKFYQAVLEGTLSKTTCLA
ncbi:MAG TPA: glycosyltransferase family 4 protein [Nitrospirota bacterium]|nr:glycosyltransferase family 4 protein [Nitrospirota bacterium]